jgi:lipopolysaccharide transport system permease protein
MKTWQIQPGSSWRGATFKELVEYKDLLFRLTRKEFLGSYQQTLLGPIWILLQPIITVLTFVLVFNNILGLSTNGVPPFLFNLTGITLWNLFSEIFLNTSKTFTQNALIFNKVYFPRIIAALSALLLQLILFSIQLLLLIVVYLIYYFKGVYHLDPENLIYMFPAIIVTTGIGFGLGLLFSVITGKYRDLLAMLQLIVRLLLFICPVFYSLQMVPSKVKWLVGINPLSIQFELFRLSFLGATHISMAQFIYSFLVMVFVLLAGIFLFNKWCDRLMDVI